MTTDTDGDTEPNEERLRQWHRLFGIALMGVFEGAPWRVELEQELALRSQLLDVAIIEATTADSERAPTAGSNAARPPAPPLELPDELPDGLENLRPHNLLTYKSRFWGTVYRSREYPRFLGFFLCSSILTALETNHPISLYLRCLHRAKSAAYRRLWLGCSPSADRRAPRWRADVHDWLRLEAAPQRSARRIERLDSNGASSLTDTQALWRCSTSA